MSTALITGASSGIGAVYARRFASRGHDLVLVARTTQKLEDLAAELRAAYGVKVEFLTADLINATQRQTVENRLRDGSPIDVLVNNAGDNIAGTIAETKPVDLEKLVTLNVTVPTLLAAAAASGMARRGTGTIINIGSVVGFMPEHFSGIYAATKSYILTLSQSLATELGSEGVHVQAVVPAATRTAIWERSGVDANTLPNLMEVDDLVDAALVGLDRKELVTIPPLGDEALWQNLESARHGLLGGLGGTKPAERYRLQK
ncbi:SDR family oxidoreductase [Devosia sp. Leaf64]|uniref:SDR family NAD(P)-dependent oxidoreductase n=1 Tax=Devosia sp. Leaf64 TaxID=1736229 RepID=UPI00071280E8|nr:SDR family oxidoreductase [Devosia sp. Leaf64]KQN78265.1 AraC family transcriptional regulator [Devosia sp. Leaf64]